MKRMNLLTKWMCSALALCVLTCLAALPAMADDTRYGYGSYTYTLDDSGNATIVGYSGTDSVLIIPDTLNSYPVVAIGEEALWCNSFTSVTVPEGVVSIGSRAFYTCNNLTTVILPDSLTEIGSSAFYGCRKLSSITLPENLVSIGASTFSNCSALTEIALPAGITSIEDSTFYWCSSLVSVSLPDTLTSIGNYAFSQCSDLEQLSIPDGLISLGSGPFYDSTVLLANRSAVSALTLCNAGFTFIDPQQPEFTLRAAETDGVRTFTLVSASSTATSLTIPEHISVIGTSAFSSCTALTSVSLPVNLTEIGQSAFYACTSLSAVYLPDHIATIGASAFYNLTTCYADMYSATALALTAAGKSFYDIDYSNLALRAYETDGVRRFTLYGCRNDAAYVIIPSGVTSIRYNAFYGCSSLGSVIIPDTVTEIQYRAFENCTALTSITIPDSVTAFGEGMFNGCSSLISVTLPDHITELNGTFYGCTSLRSVSLPSALTSLGTYTFYNCKSLTEITLPDGITSIPYESFANCTSLKTVYLPSTLTSIDSYAFDNCSALASVALPDTLTSIGAYAFSDCDAYTPIRLPDNLTTLDKNAFSGYFPVLHADPDGVSALTLTASGFTFRDPAQPLLSLKAYETDGVRTVTVSSCDTSATSVTLPENTTEIATYAFSTCTKLTGIYMPDGVTTIGTSAFNACTAVCYANSDSTTALTLTTFGKSFRDPDYPALSLKAYETDGQRSITVIACDTDATAVTLPPETTAIGEKAFFNCTALTEIHLSENITSVGASAFSDCPAKLHASRLSATALVLSVTDPEYPHLRIKAYETDGVRSFTIMGCAADAVSVALPEGTTAIASYAFYGCTLLQDVTIPDSLTSIGSYAFYGCTPLKDIAIPDGVTSIGSYAFYKCTALEEISLPAFLASLGQSAFSGCTSLRSANMTQSAQLTALPNYAFENCTALTALYLPENIASIGTNSFYNCSPVFYVNVDSTTALTLTGRGYSFTDAQHPGMLFKAYETNGVRSFTVTGSLADITTAVIPEGTTTIAASAFKDCAGLLSVSLPEGVTEIGNSAFSGCSRLREINIPSSMTTLGYGVFSGCETLTQVHLPDSLTSVGTQLFSGCSALSDVTLPAGMAELPSGMFLSCAALERVQLPSGLTAIGSSAFSGCTALSQLTLPQSLTAIGYYAFNGCAALASLSIPDGLSSIDSSALPKTTLLYASPDSAAAVTLTGASYRFCLAGYEDFKLTASDSDDGMRTITLAECTAEDRTQVVIPEGVHVIGDSVFANWTDLASVTFPSTLREINGYAFRYCSAITELSFPEGFTTLGRNALNECAGLVSVSLPSTLKTIAYNAFCNCDSLAEVVIPDGVTTIEAGAFNSCDPIRWVNLNTPAMNAFSATSYAFRTPEYPLLSFKSVADESGNISLTVSDCDQTATTVSLPQGVTAIGQYAFSGCSALETITLPNTITTLEEDAFYGCSSLRMLSLPDSITSIGEDAFNSCSRLASITIPEGVTALPADMANYCSSMTSAMIPASVTSIASNAFYNVLSTVYCYRGSYADTWAQSTGRIAIYLDDVDIEDYISLTGETAISRDHGTAINWRSLVSLAPLPQGSSYTLRCASSDDSIANVSGDIVSVLKTGTATLTVTVAELPWLSHAITLTAYNPVESFSLPTALFMPAGGGYEDRVTLKPENVFPDNTDPRYTWIQNSYSQGTAESQTYWPYSSANISTVTATSQSGVTRSCKVVTYASIGNLRFKEFAKRIEVGTTITPGVILFLDGVAYVDEPALYTLSSSNESVARPTADGRLYIAGTGSATITVTALGGQTASQTLTVSDVRVLMLPAALKVISDEAFAASSAQVVIIPDGCVSIGSRAFANCTDLFEITIPASVTDIAEDAFEGCSGVTVIAPEGSAGQAIAESCGFTWQAL